MIGICIAIMVSLVAINLYVAVQQAEMHGSINLIEMHMKEQHKLTMRLVNEIKRGS
jgi:hypothetical protein